VLAIEPKNLGFTVIDARNFVTFYIWMENYTMHPAWVKALINTTLTMGKILSKIVPMDSKLFSPYIQIRAELPA